MDATTSIINNVFTIQEAFKVISVLNLTSHIWPKETDIDAECPTAYDFIVAGAGSAGCVVAARLAEAGFHVLLIEAGDDPPIETEYPSLYLFLSRSHVDWKYFAEYNEKADQCHKTNMFLSRGKMIGGSGSMNGMIYVRGNYRDFQLWAEAANDSSWRYENLLPFFKKSEQLLDQETLRSEYGRYHGTTGPMKVTRQPHKELNVYLKAFAEMGHKTLLDVNGNETLGITDPMLNIAKGRRWSSAYAFLANKKMRNLHVLKNTLVSKVLFDSRNNAVGVEAIHNNKTVQLKAKKEVIISAGAFNTPKILLLSGVGPKKHLDKLGIKVRSDLPVGENLHDHLGLFVVYSMDKNEAPPPPPQPATEFPGYLLMGYIALNKTQPYPDYQIATFRVPDDAMGAALFCSYHFNLNICDEIQRTSQNRTLLYNIVVGLHMKYRGNVKLRSLNPQDAPVIDLNTYANEEDVETAAKFIEDFIQIGKTSTMKNLNAELMLFDIPGCEGVEKGSHEYWKCYVRCFWISEYHYAGTAALGSVLNSNLKVKGVNRLRVADASVMPIVTSGNTNAPTVMVGEKAAHMIIESHSRFKN